MISNKKREKCVKNRENTVKVREKPVILGSPWSVKKLVFFVIHSCSHRIVAVQLYPCSTMGVVEDLLEKAKERAARASAKINASPKDEFGPKIALQF